MLVATRISLVLVAVTACAEPGGGATGDDGADNVKLQCSSSVWTCPAPSSGSKQTICGQLYDLATNAALVGSAATACTTPTTSGPCSLAIEAYDAIAFAVSSGTTPPLVHGAVEIDGCGRYRIPDIDISSVPLFIGISIDDAAGRGVTGTTVPVALATPKAGGTTTDGLEAWVAADTTTAQWSASGGPALANGIFVPMFRAHMLTTPQTDPLEGQPGVTFTRNGSPVAEDYYFGADATERMTIDTEAVATGANGTALVTGVRIEDLLTYGGVGGLADETNCRWPSSVGVAIPNTVFVQIFRPIGTLNQVCSL